MTLVQEPKPSQTFDFKTVHDIHYLTKLRDANLHCMSVEIWIRRKVFKVHICTVGGFLSHFHG